MDHLVARSGNSSPRNLRIRFSQVCGKVLHRLTDDLDAPEDGVLHLLVHEESVVVQIGDIGFDEDDALKDMT